VLEQNDLGAQILAAVNAKLIDRGLMLKTGTAVDATLIAAPSSTKNDKGERDPKKKSSLPTRATEALKSAKRFRANTLAWTGKLP